MEVEDRTFGEKVSDSVAIFGGSWWFILSGAIFITSWVVLNIAPFFEWINSAKY